MQKQYAVLLTGLVLLCSILFIAPASAASEASDETRSMLDRLLYESYGYSATVRYAQAGDFIVSERENGDWRGLAIFSKHAGAWQVDFLNGHAMRHQRNVTTLEARENPAQVRWTYEADGVTEHFTFEGPKDEAGAYHWQLREYTRIQADAGRWTLTATDPAGASWQTTSYPPGSSEPEVAYHKGSLQSDLRFFKLDAFPTDEKALISALVVLPDGLTANGAYTLSIDATWMECRGDLIYPVYAGPGSEYLRAAGGKAEVSTNDSIWVFGEENGYMMMYYTIGKERVRVGYIPVEALAYGNELETLRFAYLPVTVAQPCELTDDPMQSGQPLLSLAKGSTVSYLSRFRGNWAYVETRTQAGEAVRGFVPMDHLTWE